MQALWKLPDYYLIYTVICTEIRVFTLVGNSPISVPFSELREAVDLEQTLQEWLPAETRKWRENGHSVKRGAFYAPGGRQWTGRDVGDAPLPSNSIHKEAFMALPVSDSVILSSDTDVKIKHAVRVKDIQKLSETKIN
jgi:hypothetical protein